jgi:hypothetical protein
MTAVNNYTAAPAAEFQELLDRIEREPEAPEAWTTIERVARAICESDEDGRWESWPEHVREVYRKYAVAAVVTIDTGQQTAALRRVLALADELIGEARKAAASADPELTHPYINAACRIRAAVAGQP